MSAPGLVPPVVKFPIQLAVAPALDGIRCPDAAETRLRALADPPTVALDSPRAKSPLLVVRLIEAVLDEARLQGWSEVYWHTQRNNTVARGLYDKITGGTDGFVNYTITLANHSG